MSSSFKKSVEALKARYTAALEKHADGHPQGSLRVAGELGREAVAAGLNTSALAKVHRQALVRLITAGHASRNSNGKIARAATFFIAALKPLDQTHRATTQKNGRLTRLKNLMSKSTAELAAAQQRLKQELTRRKTLEIALKVSERLHTQLTNKSQRAQEHLRRLSHQILSAQEDERKRISRELHDEIGQTLTAINVRLETLKTESNINAKAFKLKIRSTQRLVESSMEKVHQFARDLRPPLLDDLGLIPALHAHLKVFTKRTGIPVELTVSAAVEEMESDKRTVIYRVVQEALANIISHARASHVSVKIRKINDRVSLEVKDNGKGFDVRLRLGGKKITRLGLLGMRERVEMVGGTFEIISELQQGTTLLAEMPFGNGAKKPRAPRRVASK